MYFSNAQTQSVYPEFPIGCKFITFKQAKFKWLLLVKHSLGGLDLIAGEIMN